MHLCIILCSSDCINTKRRIRDTKKRIRDTQSFQEMFRGKPHLTITTVYKELQNICDINQELKFKLTLTSCSKSNYCVYRNDILIKGKPKMQKKHI